MASAKKDVGVDLGLNEEEKEELRSLARAVIENKAKGLPAPTVQPTSEKLNEARGAFVTVYKQGTLRGCIGSIEAKKPLFETVKETAHSAAFGDPRFRAVTEEELPYLDVEISALTPFREIKDPEEIKVGEHGIMVSRGYHSGLLLPQVATERNWDRLTFLEETCNKAGLPRDAWKDPDTRILVFSADVF